MDLIQKSKRVASLWCFIPDISWKKGLGCISLSLFHCFTGSLVRDKSRKKTGGYWYISVSLFHCFSGSLAHCFGINI